MTLIVDVLLSNSKLKEEKIEELADIVSDAILVRMAEEDDGLESPKDVNWRISDEEELFGMDEDSEMGPEY